jgi:hypothetical protein
MHLIEQYALSCGVKIDKPFVETCFFPITSKKYITLHANSGMQAKNYDYYNEVIQMIFPYLQKEGIDIIQIGEKDDKKINGCLHYTGLTNLKQTFYIIQNSLLHFGNDSFSTHVASGFDKKIVSLYSILYKECCGPYWGKKENHELFESHRGGHKASFSNQENPKTINMIMPEKIAQSVLKLLDIKNNLNNIKTFHIGKEYHLPSISVIPNHVMPTDFIKGNSINILGDECFDEQNIAQWAYGRMANIFLDQPMKLQYLLAIKSSILRINYIVSSDTDENYIQSLKKNGIPLNLICKNEDEINDLRLKFFDWNITLHQDKTKKDLDNVDKICDNTRYKNSRTIISNGQTYASKAAWIHDVPATENKIIDCPEFWEELNTLKIYNDDNHGTQNKNSI